ncbi:MAG: hypothetical protein RMK57_05310 [Bryobacterales bacterium]|nr:hypothetical protein [Bryobacteraceae bacterium]MDW8353932.1 hypothetical protein [Bryobacterales bacterium]
MRRALAVAALVLAAAATATSQMRVRGGFPSGVRISGGFPARFHFAHPFGFRRGFFHPLPFHRRVFHPVSFSRGFFFGFRTFGSSHGFGNVLFPGVGHAPPLAPFTGFASFQPFAPIFPLWWGPVVYPIPYPVGAFGYAPSPPVVVIVQGTPSEGEVRAPIVINQQFRRTPEPEPEPKRQEPQPKPETGNPDGVAPGYRYLAFRTSAVKRVTMLDFDGATVRYRTLDGREEKASLTEVDRDLTIQLNEEIGAPVGWPALP